jgi:hypothetical protein
MGRDSVVGIATRYGLDGPGIQSQGGEIFTVYGNANFPVRHFSPELLGHKADVLSSTTTSGSLDQS